MRDVEKREAIRRQIAALRIEHRDLDDAIQTLRERPYADELQMRRLENRRLHVKEEITRLENLLIPDLDA